MTIFPCREDLLLCKEQINERNVMMKKIVLSSLAALGGLCMPAAGKATGGLQFDASKGVSCTLTMPQGKVVKYTAYTHLYYVTNVEDSTYQYLNVFVPEGATQQSPIFLRNYVGGYMAAAAGMPQAGDASGRALEEGYVLVIPGVRGRNSTVKRGKKTVYTGRAPKGLLDLKAAVRYLRLFDKVMPGDAEKIVSDGTSAGGAMSALLGATGNNPAYDKYLKDMGAADTRDDIFASVAFCPITDLEHADMAYEWLYNCTNKGNRAITEAQKSVSDELAKRYPAYLNSLKLKAPDGMPLTADNYLDYIRNEIIRSAQIAKNAGAVIPDTIGFTFSEQPSFGAPPINGGKRPAMEDRPQLPAGVTPFTKQQGEYITGLDMVKYLNYVVTTQPLKTAPAFDAMGVADAATTGENDEFGDETGTSANFTDFSAAKNGTAVSKEVKELVRIMNPMNFIDDGQSDVATHWYIRHGARDRDTAFPIPVNLALKLQNAGKNVNFMLPWNRPHSGDYALDDLFAWLGKLTK